MRLKDTSKASYIFVDLPNNKATYHKGPDDSISADEAQTLADQALADKKAYPLKFRVV